MAWRGNRGRVGLAVRGTGTSGGCNDLMGPKETAGPQVGVPAADEPPAGGHKR